MRKGGAKHSLKKKAKKYGSMKKSLITNKSLKKNIEGIFGKKVKFTKKLKTLLEKNDSDYEKYSEILNTFQKFFKSILKAEELAVDQGNISKLDDIDMVKFRIEEKLESIDSTKGNLHDRINKLAPEVFEELQEYIQPSYDSIIELYEDVLRSLRDMYDDHDIDTLHSDISFVQADIMEDLVKVFVKTKVVKNNIDTNLADMFKGLTVEKDISDIFSSLKI
jgi:hypothetical protein